MQFFRVIANLEATTTMKTTRTSQINTVTFAFARAFSSYSIFLVPFSTLNDLFSLFCGQLMPLTTDYIFTSNFQSRLYLFNPRTVHTLQTKQLRIIQRSLQKGGVTFCDDVPALVVVVVARLKLPVIS